MATAVFETNAQEAGKNGIVFRSIKIQERYNPDTGLWELCRREQPERKELTLEQVKTQITDVENKIKDISFDFDKFSEILEKVAFDASGNEENDKIFNVDNIWFLNRLFKEKAESIYNEGQKLELLGMDLRFFGISI